MVLLCRVRQVLCHVIVVSPLLFNFHWTEPSLLIGYYSWRDHFKQDKSSCFLLNAPRPFTFRVNRKQSCAEENRRLQRALEFMVPHFDYFVYNGYLWYFNISTQMIWRILKCGTDIPLLGCNIPRVSWNVQFGLVWCGTHFLCFHHQQLWIITWNGKPYHAIILSPTVVHWLAYRIITSLQQLCRLLPRGLQPFLKQSLVYFVSLT